MTTLTKEQTTKHKAIRGILLDKWHKIGLHRPENWEDIVNECYEDVNINADKDFWSSEDVMIAFKHWIECQAKYKNF